MSGNLCEYMAADDEGKRGDVAPLYRQRNLPPVFCFVGKTNVQKTPSSMPAALHFPKNNADYN